MAGSNYLIGYGEKLVTEAQLPGGGNTPKPVYTFEESLKQTSRQWQDLEDKVKSLPVEACPNNEAVFAITLHPKYLSMSYYPKSLFDAFSLRSVGSRTRRITPRKPRNEKMTSKEDVTAEYFLSVDRDELHHIVKQLPNISETLRKDYIKIEEIRPIGHERIKISQNVANEEAVWEAVLHLDEDYVLHGFRKFLRHIGIRLYFDKIFKESGLAFVSLKATPKQVRREIAQFSFLRAIRPMPSLRPIDTVFLRSRGKSIELPDEPPLEDKVRVAIMDGGLPENHGLDRWVVYREPKGLGPALPEGISHGMAVTSAFLFGPITRGEKFQVPPCQVDHWRVVDTEDFNNDEPGLYNVLERIQTILEQGSYKLVNLSLGPDLPIEDDEPHAWTAVLDKLLSNGETLLCAAAGNTGCLDWDSGNARVQPPSDLVNGLGVGAADSVNASWKRAEYSCIGPGRRPGFIKPDIIAFGGCDKEPFTVLSPGLVLKGTQGTSFSSPFAARLAMSVATFFESELTAVALKALLIHQAQPNSYEPREVGWGKVPEDIMDLVTSSDNQAHILYQGILNNNTGWKLPIPLPQGTIPGKVNIKATICFASMVDANHPLSYTRSGFTVTFRPRPIIDSKKTQSFFTNSDYMQENELRRDAMKWEPVLRKEHNFQGSSLNDPIFELHYLKRQEGYRDAHRPDLPYAVAITVTATKIPDLYNQILNRYRIFNLSPLRPRAQIRQRLSIK